MITGILLLAFSFGCIFFNSFVIMKLFNWFLFSVYSLNYMMAIGIYLVYSVLNYNTHINYLRVEYDKNKYSDTEKKHFWFVDTFAMILSNYIYGFLTLIIGYFIKFLF